MRRKLRITAVATAALLVALMATTALAGTSSATISKGQLDRYGSYQTLSATSVSCSGESYNTSGSGTRMSVNLLTKGAVFEVLKSERYFYAGDRENWTYRNSETGQFRIWLNCGNKDHNGRGSASQ